MPRFQGIPKILKGVTLCADKTHEEIPGGDKIRFGAAAGGILADGSEGNEGIVPDLIGSGDFLRESAATGIRKGLLQSSAIPGNEREDGLDDWLCGECLGDEGE